MSGRARSGFLLAMPIQSTSFLFYFLGVCILSNDEKGPWLFRFFLGVWNTTQLCGDYLHYFINHEIGVSIQQAVFQWKVRPVIFLWRKCVSWNSGLFFSLVEQRFSFLLKKSTISRWNVLVTNSMVGDGHEPQSRWLYLPTARIPPIIKPHLTPARPKKYDSDLS